MSADRMRATALVGGFLAALACAAPGLAEEGKCDCPARKTVAGIPILAKVPYVNRLFQAADTAGDDVQRIGIDFEFCADGEFPLGIRFWECGAACEGQCQAKAGCAEGKCPVNVAACDCPVAKAVCPSCQVAAKACACASESKCAAASQCACGTKCACDTKCACGDACQCSGQQVVVRSMGPVPFVTQHVPPHAVVVHHGPPHVGPAHPPVAACPAMFGHLLELTAHSAALEAKLEARDEQAELVGEMLELAQENAKLKAQVEMADAKLELAEAQLEISRHLVQMKLENEHLKAQVAELTNRLGEAEKTARTTSETPSQPRR
ncbi:MAG TPA: hypothetical protein VFV87_05530 [Pirellulaceae bacterium]|nr:hypothetical protein [Pirellulaceae bacterium]